MRGDAIGDLAHGLPAGEENRVDVAGRIADVARQNEAGSTIHRNFDGNPARRREGSHVVECLFDQVLGQFDLHVRPLPETITAGVKIFNARCHLLLLLPYTNKRDLGDLSPPAISPRCPR